jgi:hypothetical protein
MNTKQIRLTTTASMYRRDEKWIKNFDKNVKERDHLEDLRVDVSIL